MEIDGFAAIRTTISRVGLGVVLRGFVVGKREKEQGRRERGTGEERERNHNFLHVLRDMGQWKMRDNLVYGPYFLHLKLD